MSASEAQAESPARARGRTSRERDRLQRLVQVVSTGLASVLALLAGLAVWSAVDGHRSATRLERSGDLVEAYLALHRAVAVQDALEDDYEEHPGPRNRLRFERMSAVIFDALGVLRRHGNPRDRALAAKVAIHQREYGEAIQRAFDAVDAGDEERAEQIDDLYVDPPSRIIQIHVNEHGPQHANESLHEIDTLKRSQDMVFEATLLVVPLALIVLAASWSLLRVLRRGLDEVTGAELARLARAALTDSLTGIRNHSAFKEDLGRELAQRSREASALSLVSWISTGSSG